MSGGVRWFDFACREFTKHAKLVGPICDDAPPERNRRTLYFLLRGFASAPFQCGERSSVKLSESLRFFVMGK